MAIHDAYARITPYELALPGRPFARERLEAVAEEGRARGLPLDDMGTFRVLEATREALEAIRGEGEGSEWGGLDPYALLLFHAFHFWRHGESLFLLRLSLARGLAEDRSPAPAGPPEGWDPPLPSAAGYLQLPRNLFWVALEEGGVPEAVDGFFWSPAAGDRLAVLAVTGMRDGRPGVGVLPLPPVPLEHLPRWPDMEGRPGGGDFETSLPGGELERLYSLESPGEILKLLARVFRYMAREPGSRESELPGGGPGASVGGTPPGAAALSPRPSALGYRSLSLRGPAVESVP